MLLKSITSSIQRTVLLKNRIHKYLRFCLWLIFLCHLQLVNASQLLFEDNFENESIDPSIWRQHNPGARFGAINSEEAVAVSGGNLSISTFHQNDDVLTGMISTASSHVFQKGYIEMRVKFPDITSGRQCAIWLQSPLFGSTQTDPELKAESTGSIITLARYAPNWKGVVTSDVTWGNWGDKKQSQKSKTPVALNDGNFHVFGLELLDDRYRFYLDGKPYWEASEGISGVPMYMVITCEVKKNLGIFEAVQSAQSFDIDYMRHYDAYHVESKEVTGTPINADDWYDKKENGNLTFGDFRDDPEFKPSQPGDFEAMRVELKEGSHLGVDALLELPDQSEEAWIQYCILFSESWQASVGGKLPGFAGKSGWWSGGQGGKPSNGRNAWSARMLYGKYEPETKTIPLGQYVYHTDQGKISKYGDPEWWTQKDNRPISASARAQRNQWVSIKQHVKVNSQGKHDGVIEGWVDGKLVYSRDNYHFSNSSKHRMISKFWLDVYYGGGDTANSDQVVFFDQFNYSLDQDKTSSHCPYIPSSPG